MFRTVRTTLIVGFMLILVLLVGCAPSRYPLATPVPSGIPYAKVKAAKLTATFVDERREADKVFHTGILPAALENEGKPVEPVEFLARNVEKELKARGVDIDVVEQGQKSAEGINVLVRKFRIRNHRTSGFSPYYTFTTISADVEANGKTNRVVAYFKNGKVPVWSFDEVIEPCYTIPINIAVKEFASKVNRLTINASISDADVDAIAEGIKNSNAELGYLDVYKLGFSNNKRAIPYLVELTKNNNILIRIAAISSLGTIGAEDQVSYLKNLYNDSIGQQEERNMALKSIGDFGTPDAIEFVKDAMRDLQSQTNNSNAQFAIEIASLYL